MPERVTLAELIEDAMNARLRDLHVAMPAKVQSYNLSKQTVDVVPQLNLEIPDSEGGFAWETLPVLSDVPVAFPRGGGGMVTFPLQAGDFVLVVFCERDLSVWRTKGDQCSPGDVENHGLSSGVAIPCNLYPDAKALTAAHAQNIVVGFDSGAQIHIKPSGEIDLSQENAADFVALAQKVLSELNKISTAFSGHTHAAGTLMSPSGTTGGAVTGATAAGPTYSSSAVAASKVKAT